MSADPDFKTRFNAVLDDLDANGRKDHEAMWLLGSLAARLVKETRAQNWADLKSRISPPSRTELVGTLDREATALDAAGKAKPAYAARILGISLVAGTILDPQLIGRDRLLDNFIDTAAIVFIQNHNAAAR